MGKDVEVIKVEKIVLNIKGKKIELSPDEARTLRDSLNGVVGDTWHWTYPVYPTYPNPWLNFPSLTWDSNDIVLYDDDRYTTDTYTIDIL